MACTDVAAGRDRTMDGREAQQHERSDTAASLRREAGAVARPIEVRDAVPEQQGSYAYAWSLANVEAIVQTTAWEISKACWTASRPVNRLRARCGT